MKASTLTLSEAQELAQNFHHLIGKALICEHTDFCLIECITPAPFDEINKWIFANRYKDGCELATCMEFYHGPGYDVLIIARSARDKSIVLYETLSNYLSHETIDLTDEHMPAFLS